MTLPPAAATATLIKDESDIFVKQARGELVMGQFSYSCHAVIEGNKIFITLRAPRSVWSEPK